MKIERNMRHDEYQVAEHWCLTKLPRESVLFFSVLLLDVAFFFLLRAAEDCLHV